MTDDVTNLVLEPLRALRNDVLGMRTDMHAEFKDLKLRLGSLESVVVSSRRHRLKTVENG